LFTPDKKHLVTIVFAFIVFEDKMISPEEWQSGRMHLFRKQTYQQWYRGFESYLFQFYSIKVEESEQTVLLACGFEVKLPYFAQAKWQ
jgi:hypothetical protein